MQPAPLDVRDCRNLSSCAPFRAKKTPKALALASCPPQVEALDRILTRLAMTEEAALGDICCRLLPRLLPKLGTPLVPVRHHCAAASLPAAAVCIAHARLKRATVSGATCPEHKMLHSLHQTAAGAAEDDGDSIAHQ